MAIEKVSMYVARKIAGLTQQEMARLCNVSISTLSNWENGRTEPTVSQAMRYAEACKLTIDDIIFLS